MLTHRLRGNRDDLTALHWSNLLVVEQGFSSAPPIHKIKRPVGRVYFMADGEGFEPPVELPPQRFSRPSQSTALPPIRNFFPPVFQTCGFVRCPHPRRGLKTLAIIQCLNRIVNLSVTPIIILANPNAHVIIIHREVT